MIRDPCIPPWQDDFVIFWVFEGSFDEGVTVSCVLCAVEEVAPEEALDEIKKNPITDDVMMVLAVDVLWGIAWAYVGLWTPRMFYGTHVTRPSFSSQLPTPTESYNVSNFLVHPRRRTEYLLHCYTRILICSIFCGDFLDGRQVSVYLSRQFIPRASRVAYYFMNPHLALRLFIYSHVFHSTRST